MLPIGSIIYLKEGNRKIMVLNRGAMLEQLTDGRKSLQMLVKSIQEHDEVSREANRFLLETSNVLRGSTDQHVFIGALEEHNRLSRKISSDFEEQQEEFRRQQRQMEEEKIAIEVEIKKIEKEKSQ